MKYQPVAGESPLILPSPQARYIPSNLEFWPLKPHNLIYIYGTCGHSPYMAIKTIRVIFASYLTETFIMNLLKSIVGTIVAGFVLAIVIALLL